MEVVRLPLVGGEIGRVEKKEEKTGERGVWLVWGGGRKFWWARVFSFLAHQNPISPIWIENLGDFASTQSIIFLSLFL